VFKSLLKFFLQYRLAPENAFNALTLLDGLGHQEEQPSCNRRVRRCWHGVRCKLFACGAADATATDHLLLH